MIVNSDVHLNLDGDIIVHKCKEDLLVSCLDGLLFFKAYQLIKFPVWTLARTLSLDCYRSIHGDPLCPATSRVCDTCVRGGLARLFPSKFAHACAHR